MKGSISFLPAEQERADAWVEAIRAIEPGLKVHRSESHPPQVRIYMKAPTHPAGPKP